MKRLCFISVILIFGIIFNLSGIIIAGDNDADKIVNDFKKKFDEIKTFKADFVHTFHWKLANNTNEQEGTIWIQGTEKFKIETSDQMIVSNGKIIWTYSKDNNQVIIDNVENSEDVNLPREIFLTVSEKYNAKYLMQEKLSDSDCHVIEMIPKSNDLFIKYMKIWIMQKEMLPAKIEQIDINENVNTYVLNNILLDEVLAKDFFEYKKSGSVEIIDMR